MSICACASARCAATPRAAARVESTRVRSRRRGAVRPSGSGNSRQGQGERRPAREHGHASRARLSGPRRQSARDGGRYVLANGRAPASASPRRSPNPSSSSPRSSTARPRGADFPGGADRSRRHRAAVRGAYPRGFGHRLDEREQAIRARRERRFGALLLQSSDLRDPDPAAWAAAALTGVRQLGIAALPWTRSCAYGRPACPHGQFAVPAPQSWPDLSDEALAATLDSWAPRGSRGSRGGSICPHGFGQRPARRLSYAQGAILEREAPTHFVVPSARVSHRLSRRRGTTLSVRLQELFGMQRRPASRRRLPLLLKLLSPRAVPCRSLAIS